MLDYLRKAYFKYIPLSKQINIENVCCIYPCSVFIKISTLKKALKILKKKSKIFHIPNYAVFSSFREIFSTFKG